MEEFYSIVVHPKSSRNEVVKKEDGAYHVYVTVVPEKGKANERVIELLAKELGVAKTRLVVARGQTSKRKTITLQ